MQIKGFTKRRLPRKIKKLTKTTYKKQFNLKWWLKCEDIFAWNNFLIKNKMNFVK